LGGKAGGYRWSGSSLLIFLFAATTATGPSHSILIMGKKDKKEAAEEEAEEEVEEPEKEKEAYLSPLADSERGGGPIIEGKLLSRVQKLVKKAAAGKKQLRRGVPECVKSIRKDQKGVVLIAGDIYPPDIAAHVPILCEEKDVPYAFVRTRKDLGDAVNSRRAVSLVLVNRPKKDDENLRKTYDQVEEGLRAVNPQFEAK